MVAVVSELLNGLCYGCGKERRMQELHRLEGQAHAGAPFVHYQAARYASGLLSR